jgi:LacI family transcriptional regulator
MTTTDAVARPGPATIATIADEVGVSVTTVSKVLNGRVDVSPDTRARVEASLERHRYRRRSRRQSVGTGQIDLVFHELDSAWVLEIIRGVEAVAAASKIEVVLSQL